MASSISAGTTSATALVHTADTTGALELKTNNGTTAVTIDTSQNVAFAKGFTVGATAAPAFSAYPSATTSLVQFTVTKITYGTEEWDTNNNFASSRFTPTVAGYYQVNAATSLASGSALTYIWIYKNGSAYKNGNLVAASNWTIVSCQVYLNGSTDYIEVYVQQNAATQTNETTSSSNYFQAAMIRSA
jgi:hypothetical protein